MKQVLLYSLALICVICGCQSSGVAGTPSATPEPLNITSHKITAELNPLIHYIAVTDTLEATVIKQSVPPKAGNFYFALHPGLELKSLVWQDNKNPILLNVTKGKLDWLQQYNFSLPLSRSPEPDKFTLIASYSGKIFDKPEDEKTLGFVAGGRTSGVISEQGVYLHHGTGWYPRLPSSPMIKFEVTTLTPAGWESVGQDELKSRTTKDNITTTTWTSNIPFDGYTLVAGPYIITSEMVNGVRVAAYFYKQSQQFAKTHIDAARKFLSIFQSFLAPYPYKSFSIVENFFTTGYGMPSYTLLGSDVIMMGRHANEGGIGHEMMHCWWGNYVNVDESRGNWCEGLTTYCANYYYLELKKTPRDSLNYRRINCVKFSAFVNEGNDKPVRTFVGKQAEIDNEIGYGKPAAMFHMIRKMIGDDAFFGALRLVIKEKGGNKANWEDFQFAFEKTFEQSAKDKGGSASGGKLQWFFDQWLDRTGIPDLTLENPAVNNNKVSFTIRQNTVPPFKLMLPVVITTDQGKEEKTVEVSNVVENKTVEVSGGKVLSIAIDPEHHIFRRFKDKELWPCLGATMGDKNLIVIYPSAGTPEENALYKKVAERVSNNFKAAMKGDNEISQTDLNNNSIILLGSPAVNLATAQLVADSRFSAGPASGGKPANCAITKDGFRINDTNYHSQGQALMASFWSPYNSKKYITLFMGLSQQAAERPARVIFFYRWDHYLIFEQGQMIRKGDFTAPFNSLEHRFADAPETAQPPVKESTLSEAIRKHCTYLSSDKLAGRTAGTEGDKLAAEYIASEFRKYGLETEMQAFDIQMQKLGKKTSFGMKPTDKWEVKQYALGRDFLPLNFSANKESNGAVISANYGISSEEFGYDDYANLDVKDKIVVVKAGLPEPLVKLANSGTITASKHASSFLKTVTAQKRGARGIIIVAQKGLSDDCAVWQEFPSEAFHKRLQSPEAAASNMTLRFLVLGGQSRISTDPLLPAVVVTEEVGKELLAAPATANIATETTWEKDCATYNVIGTLKGELLPSVVIGAHYDHLGVSADNKYFPGANDNASGVAGLLAIAETMAKSGVKPKRNIVFVAFGAEEFGLYGSRYYAKHNTSPSKTIAMLNMDMLGRGNPTELYVMGVLRNPELYDVVKKANAQTKLTLKDNIEFTFKFGSDYYSFYEEKIPSLNFTSSRFMEQHTVNDTADKLDIEKIENAINLVSAALLEIANSSITFPLPREVEVPFPGGMGPGMGGGHPGGRQGGNR
ncbi:MAG: M20/M25/M40 family metallo-hydrolase [Planctomycetota bacterium]